MTATFGEETFSPAPYHTLRLGPFSYTTRVKAGETPGQALERADAWVRAHARRSWAEKLKSYEERMNGGQK